MGSLALMDIDRGQIKRLEIPGGGPYDFQGQLTAQVAAPEPLRLIQPVWQLQDANWFPDWPTSAEKIMWFLNKSGAPTFDGVIAVTSDVMEDLLMVTGPIEMNEYGLTIDSDNFWYVTENQVENEYGIYGNVKSNRVVVKCIELSPNQSKLMVAVAGYNRDSVELVRNKIIVSIQ